MANRLPEIPAECRKNCPRIETARKAASDGIVLGPPDALGFSSIITDQESMQALENAERNAQNCHGPINKGTREVKRGLLRRPAVEVVWDCEVNPESAPKETPEEWAPGFRQTASEVIRENPLGFYSALIDLVRGRGDFEKKE